VYTQRTGAVQPQRRQPEDRLHALVGAAAEVAAHQRRHDADPVERQAEGPRHLERHQVRVARARVDHHVAVFVEIGERGLRLEGGVLVERRVEGRANGGRGGGEPLLDVATLHDLLREDVALLVNPDRVRFQRLVW
jgi:hypothetical protein